MRLSGITVAARKLDALCQEGGDHLEDIAKTTWRTCQRLLRKMEALEMHMKTFGTNCWPIGPLEGTCHMQP